jgi:hypothetical protein
MMPSLLKEKSNLLTIDDDMLAKLNDQSSEVSFFYRFYFS